MDSRPPKTASGVRDTFVCPGNLGRRVEDSTLTNRSVLRFLGVKVFRLDWEHPTFWASRENVSLIATGSRDEVY